MMITKEELAEQLKKNVDWLMKQKEGCCHWHLLTDMRGREWCIVLGWGEGFEENDPSLFSDGTYALCTKIAYNNSDLQCDYAYDFEMPYNEHTGEVDDTDSSVSRDVDFLELAGNLLKEFKRVVTDWVTFDEENQKYLEEIKG